MDNRTLGSEYEKKARHFLEEQGVKVITMNYHFHKAGEIDIIYKDFVNENGNIVNYLCFGEVKYRRNNYSGNAVEAVDYNKIKKISRTAYGYMKQNKISPDYPMRFDVIAIDRGSITWIKNAFYPVL